jgi:hypothetical protein
MFFPRSQPLALDESGLHGLRLALNTPVLSIQELPPGPATAAIAIHTEKSGERALTIAVRALRSGRVVFFTLDEDLSHEGAVLGAIDGALSFAEAMGFLFDDELEITTPAQRKRALGRWRELVSESRSSSVGAAAEELLVLEETVELEQAAPPDDPPPLRSEASYRSGSGHAENKAPAAAAGKGAGRGVSLTKFRKRSAVSTTPHPEGGARSDAPPGAQASRKAVLMTPHGPALGRLQLIKRRRSGDASPAASWLARLLGSF